MRLCITSIIQTITDNHTLDDRNHQGHHTTLLQSKCACSAGELIWSTFLSASETKSFCSTDLKLWGCLLHRLALMWLKFCVDRSKISEVIRLLVMTVFFVSPCNSTWCMSALGHCLGIPLTVPTAAKRYRNTCRRFQPTCPGNFLVTD